MSWKTSPIEVIQVSSQFFGLTVARVQITRGVSDFLEGRSVYARETFLRCRANDEALEASEWLECHFDRKRFVFQVRGKVSDENAARATAALLFVRDRWENILSFRLFRVRSTISFDFWTWSKFLRHFGLYLWMKFNRFILLRSKSDFKE